jgi:hypothetical protein
MVCLCTHPSRLTLTSPSSDIHSPTLFNQTLYNHSSNQHGSRSTYRTEDRICPKQRFRPGRARSWYWGCRRCEWTKIESYLQLTPPQHGTPNAFNTQSGGRSSENQTGFNSGLGGHHHTHGVEAADKFTGIGSGSSTLDAYSGEKSGHHGSHGHGASGEAVSGAYEGGRADNAITGQSGFLSVLAHSN